MNISFRNIQSTLLILKHPVTPIYKKVQVGGQQNISFSEGKKIINSFEMDFVNSFSFLHAPPLLKVVPSQILCHEFRSFYINDGQKYPSFIFQLGGTLPRTIIQISLRRFAK